MNLNGTITKNIVRSTVFDGPVSIVMTIDRPLAKSVQVQLSNNWQTDISGADYTALSTKWSTDSDLINFIATKFGLSVS